MILYIVLLFLFHIYLLTGTLEVRLMGCQDILENVPGRSKATSVALPGWSPSENRSSFMSRTSKSKSGSSRNLLKTDDLSSSVTMLFKIMPQIKGPYQWRQTKMGSVQIGPKNFNSYNLKMFKRIIEYTIKNE